MERRLMEKRGGGERIKKEREDPDTERRCPSGKLQKKRPDIVFLRLPCRIVSSDLLKAHTNLQFSRFEANQTL